MKDMPRALIDWCVSHHMAPCDLDVHAEKARGLYCDERKKYTGGYRPSGKHDDAWRKTAMACIDAGASISDWVTAQFDQRTTLPYPVNLHDKHARQHYVDWLSADDVEVIRLELASYASIVRKWRCTHSVADVLTDARHGFPPLFIWCIAEVAGLDDIASAYRDSALRQYGRPAYRKAYHDKFSDVITKLEGG